MNALLTTGLSKSIPVQESDNRVALKMQSQFD